MRNLILLVHSRYWRKSLRKSWLFHHLRILNKIIGFLSKRLLASAKKLSYSCQNCAILFQRYTSMMKAFDENPKFLNQLTTSRSKNLTEFWRERFGSAIRTAFNESRRRKWRNKCSKKYFILFWVYAEGLLFFDMKKSEVLSKPNSRCAKDQWEIFVFEKIKMFVFFGLRSKIFGPWRRQSQTG